MNSYKISALALLVLSVIAVSSPSRAADALQGLTSALQNSLNQSVRNTQSGVQSGVQNSIQQNIAHPSEVNAGKAMANNTVLSSRTLCSQIPAELRNKYTQVCASFNANNPCSALPIAGNLTVKQSQLQALCNSRQSMTTLEGQAAAQVMPSSGTVSQQIQNKLANFGNK